MKIQWYTCRMLMYNYAGKTLHVHVYPHSVFVAFLSKQPPPYIFWKKNHKILSTCIWEPTDDFMNLAWGWNMK